MERFEFIRRCRALGIGLGNVQELLSFRDQPREHCEGVNEVIDERIAQIGAQMAELRTLQEELVHLRESCPGDRLSADCAILRSLSANGSPR